MELIVFEKDAYWKMQSELFRMFREALREATKPADDWINTEEAKKLLGVRSKSKMQELRDTDAIEFSKDGKIIMYSKASILRHLERNRVK